MNAVQDHRGVKCTTDEDLRADLGERIGIGDRPDRS
jgi:hypothetical protein